MKKSLSIIPAGIQCMPGKSMSAIARVLRSGNHGKLYPVSIASPDDTRPYALIDGTLHAANPARAEELIVPRLTDSLDKRISSGQRRYTVPFFYGSTSLNTSDIPSDSPASVAMVKKSDVGRAIAEKAGLQGLSLTVSTACTSAATALISCADLLACGGFSLAAVAGCDCYSKQIFQGFESLKLLSRDRCRPFDASRSGIVLGEGAASVLLDADDDDGPFRYRGGAVHGDTYDQTTHHPDGSAIGECITKALADAGCTPDAIDSIKSHGTGSGANDAAEAAAIKTVFGSTPPPVIALKPFTGHTLGACGLVELMVVLSCAGQGFLPGVPTFERADPEYAIEPLRSAHPITFPHTTLLCFFGFGGSCAAFIVTIRKPLP